MIANQVAIRKQSVKPIVAITEAWTGFNGNFWTLFIAIIITGIIQTLIGLIPFVSIFILPFVYGPLQSGVSKMMLDVADGDFVNVGDVFGGFQKFLTSAIVALLVSLPLMILLAIQLAFMTPGVSEILVLGRDQAAGALDAISIIAIGFTLLITLIYYVGVVLSFFSFFLIMDKDLEPIDAVKVSAKGVIGNFGRLFILGVLFFLVNLAGLLVFGIGMLFTIPVTLLGAAFAYRDIFPKDAEIPTSQDPPAPDDYGNMFTQIS